MADNASVAFLGNRYSVPPGLAGSTLVVRRRLSAPTIDVVAPSGAVLVTHRLAPAGSGALVRSVEHKEALEAAVLSAFTTARPCDKKANRPALRLWALVADDVGRHAGRERGGWQGEQWLGVGQCADRGALAARSPALAPVTDGGAEDVEGALGTLAVPAPGRVGLDHRPVVLGHRSEGGLHVAGPGAR